MESSLEQKSQNVIKNEISLWKKLYESKWLRLAVIIPFLYLIKPIFAGAFTLVLISYFFVELFSKYKTQTENKIVDNLKKVSPKDNDVSVSMLVEDNTVIDLTLVRPNWVKYVAIINLLLLVLGGQYLFLLPFATFIGLAFSGADRWYFVLMFFISAIGSLSLIPFTVASICLAFQQKFQNNFSKFSKLIMFTPIVSAIFASVFIIELVTPSVIPNKGPKKDFVYVDDKKVPVSEFSWVPHSPYAIRNGEVYVNSCIDCSAEEYIVMKGVATSSFSVLDYSYARDDKHVYFYEKIVPEADPSSFEMISKSYFGNDVWRDKSHLFMGTKLLSNNPDSYKSFNATFSPKNDYNYFGADSSVYLNGSVIWGADSNTFKVVSPPFSSDEKHVYCAERLIEGADPKTFVTFESKDVVAYGKDNKYAYFCSRYAGRRIVQIEEVDIDSFDATGMKYGYAKDKYREYYFSGVGYQEEKTQYKVKVY